MTPAEDPRGFLADLFHAAVTAADPLEALRHALPEKPVGRTIVIGAGKGAAQLAAAFEDLWDGPLEGCIVTRYGYACATKTIEVLEAAHPVPDAAGLMAGKRLLELVSGLTADDLVVALVCGGGSALLPAPPDGLTLADEIAVNEALLASGAPISEMNTVRKHLSLIKGGRLAAAASPARVVSLVVSDIPGDNPAFVASGPTVPDTANRIEALRIVEQYGMDLPNAVMAHLNDPKADAPMPDDPVFERHGVTVIASSSLSLAAAARLAETRGVHSAILSDSIEGEARDIGRMHGAIARQIAQTGSPLTPPVVLLSGGETTVTVRAKGRGGRNGELALALAKDIQGLSTVTALSADTDGIDGTEDNAGAFADGGTWQKLIEQGLDPNALLAGNDSYTGFAASGELFVTGPTGTNVNDFRAVLITA
ncbi:MAG: glycerate kinase [Pseudomonadota bacterium]